MPTLIALQNLFREIFDDDNLVLTNATGMADVDGWDSVAQVKLILAVEDEFGMQLEMNEAASLRTAGDYVERIEQGKRRAA